MKHLLMIVFAMLLSGCAASGIEIKEEQLNFLKIGKSTVQEAIDRLGQPNMIMRNPDGTRMISYIYSEAQTRPETFVPIVGAFIGGMDVRSNMVMLQFDNAGLFLTHSASSFTTGTGTNLSSGVTPNRIEGQPKQSQ